MSASNSNSNVQRPLRCSHRSELLITIARWQKKIAQNTINLTSTSRSEPMIKFNHKLFTRSTSTLFLCAALLGCGGGDSGSESANPETPKYYGAFAYAQNNRSFSVGTVASISSQEAANSAAIDRCGRSGCAVILEFTECGSVVVGKTASGSFVWGTASRATAEEARSVADSVCRKKGGLGCVLGNVQPVCNAH